MPVQGRRGIVVDPRDLPVGRPKVSETEAAVPEEPEEEDVVEDEFEEEDGLEDDEAGMEDPLPAEEPPAEKDEFCSACGDMIRVGMWPFCDGTSGKHVWTSERHIFKPFVTEVGGKQVVIDSIQAAARVERETMQRYRNGEGAPMVFRAFHQDKSNFDVNALGPNPQKKPREGFSTKTVQGTPFVNRARS